MKIYLHHTLPHYFIVNKGRVFSLDGIGSCPVFIYNVTSLDKDIVNKNYMTLTPDETKEVQGAIAPYFGIIEGNNIGQA